MSEFVSLLDEMLDVCEAYRLEQASEQLFAVLYTLLSKAQRGGLLQQALFGAHQDQQAHTVFALMRFLNEFSKTAATSNSGLVSINHLVYETLTNDGSTSSDATPATTTTTTTTTTLESMRRYLKRYVAHSENSSGEGVQPFGVLDDVQPFGARRHKPRAIAALSKTLEADLDEMRSLGKPVWSVTRSLISALCSEINVVAHGEQRRALVARIVQLERELPVEQLQALVCHRLMHFYVTHTLDTAKAMHYYEQMVTREQQHQQRNATLLETPPFQVNKLLLLNYLIKVYATSARRTAAADVNKLVAMFASELSWPPLASRPSGDELDLQRKLDQFLEHHVYASMRALDLQRLVEAMFAANYVRRSASTMRLVLLKLVEAGKSHEALAYYQLYTQHESDDETLALLVAMACIQQRHRERPPTSRNNNNNDDDAFVAKLVADLGGGGARLNAADETRLLNLVVIALVMSARQSQGERLHTQAERLLARAPLLRGGLDLNVLAHSVEQLSSSKLTHRYLAYLNKLLSFGPIGGQLAIVRNILSAKNFQHTDKSNR